MAHSSSDAAELTAPALRWVQLASSSGFYARVGTRGSPHACIAIVHARAYSYTYRAYIRVRARGATIYIVATM